MREVKEPFASKRLGFTFSTMKRSLLLSLFTLISPLHAAPFDDAAALLQSRKYAEAAAAFAALPADAGEKGHAAYLTALSLHLAGKQDEAGVAADKVPP